MQWLLLLFWGGCLLLWPRRRLSLLRHAWTAGLGLAMATQELLLWQAGLLSVQTGLPLHLCGFAGILSIPLLYRAKGGVLHAFCAYLAAPSALIALFFPSIIHCRYPQLMAAAFFQLHVLVALTPFLLLRMQKPLPTHPRAAFVLSNGYLLLVDGLNALLNTNYLFLRAAPAGTPLTWLMGRGKETYIAALQIMAMALFAWLSPLYRRLNQAIAKSR